MSADIHGSLRRARKGFVDVVFDGPPGPEAPRFAEVEDDERRSVRLGEWLERDDGALVVRIPYHHVG